MITTVLNSLLLFLGHDAPNGVNEAVNGEVNGHEHTNGINGHGVNGDSAKPSLRLSFAEYKRISNLLVLHLRHAEEGEHSAVIMLFYHKLQHDKLRQTQLEESNLHCAISPSRGRVCT